MAIIKMNISNILSKAEQYSEYKWFGITAYVYKVKYDFGHPYPWMFCLRDSRNQEYFFAGIPNELETKRAAISRAWHRAKWINNNSYHIRYK